MLIKQQLQVTKFSVSLEQEACSSQHKVHIRQKSSNLTIFRIWLSTIKDGC